jgi:isoleucyl-tRNA synthetase
MRKDETVTDENSGRIFAPVSSRVNLPELEKEILTFWKEKDIFQRSWAEGGGTQDEEKDLFVFYEGPPTANGTPGIHHVLARIFKDVIPRYKTMQGYRAVRQGGWDTHGLPVELEVEKELGISSKKEIEEYGIDRFNARCRESVMRYVGEWEELTQRIGFWVDMDRAYITFANDYIETGWWILKQLWDKGLVFQDYKVTPHCPRCVTSLSSHEVALGYQEDTPDPSVYVRFRLQAQQNGLVSDKRLWSEGPSSILAWTTTPWTLTANAALAVSPKAEYVLVQNASIESGEKLILARARVEEELGEGWKILDSFSGSDLVGISYEPLYPSPEATSDWYKIGAADYVSMEDGTGVVHTAPAYGAEDHEFGRAQGIATVHTVDQQGIMSDGYPGSGAFFKEADDPIMRDLDDRGLLYRREIYRHTYPFCWRCSTPLLYYAKPSWYIQTTKFKDELVQANSEINWFPGHIREGRFGEWLRNNVDWAISRERYWGTPIPIWRCGHCGELRCIGSVDEMISLANSGEETQIIRENLDLHRPYIDAIHLPCDKCGKSMERVPEVLDCWFDSGAMPLAQYHYPFENDSIMKDGRFPADFICEAVDQTRGWFYSLHALSVLLHGSPAYKNVICLGLILDEAGEKMSKSKGNVVEPWAVINTHGADALRWNLFTAGSPGNARRFSINLVGESVRRFLLTLWNTYSFFVTYANLDGFRPVGIGMPDAPSELDRWINSELQLLIVGVTEEFEEYNPTDAARKIEEFVELLSTWYVRRSRRRFWKSEDDDDKQAAYQTLYTCLATVSCLMAPLAPFIADELYRNLIHSITPGSPESVHLAAFPKARREEIDPDLSRSMTVAMRLSSLGRAARSKAKVKVRQPLEKLEIKVRYPEEIDLLNVAAPYILEELNVKSLEGVTASEDISFGWFDYQIRPNNTLLGPKYGRETGKIAMEVSVADPGSVVREIRAKGTYKFGEFELLAGEISVTESDQVGWVGVGEGGYAVRISSELTQELLDEGLTRELVHRIQNLRKSAGFDISDRIEIHCHGSESINGLLSNAVFANTIKTETLATLLVDKVPSEDCYSENQTIGGAEVVIGVKRVDG